MFRKIFIIMIILGVLFGASMGVASASFSAEEEPPRPGDDDPPPRPGDCDLDDWEIIIVERLAERYEVDYEEIAGWYCSGYEFSEIALAYEIAVRTDYCVEEIFIMRDDGLTWYEIIEIVGLLDRYPPRWHRLPFPPIDFDRRGPDSGLCDPDGNSPAILALADLYGITYEQAFQWICGPYDYSNTDWGDDWDFDISDFQYVDGVRLHITGPIPDDILTITERPKLRDLLPDDWDDDLPIGRRRP